MDLNILETEKKWKVYNKIGKIEIEYVFSKEDFSDKKAVEKEMKKIIKEGGE